MFKTPFAWIQLPFNTGYATPEVVEVLGVLSCNSRANVGATVAGDTINACGLIYFYYSLSGLLVSGLLQENMPSIYMQSGTKSSECLYCL